MGANPSAVIASEGSWGSGPLALNVSGGVTFGGGNVSFSKSITTTVANTIIVVVTDILSNSAPITSIGGNSLTWTKRSSFAGTVGGQAMGSEVWWAPAPAAASYTITPAWSGSPNVSAGFVVFAVSGVRSVTNPFDPGANLGTFYSAPSSETPRNTSAVTVSAPNTFTFAHAFSTANIPNVTGATIFGGAATNIGQGGTSGVNIGSIYALESSPTASGTAIFGGTANTTWVCACDALWG